MQLIQLVNTGRDQVIKRLGVSEQLLLSNPNSAIFQIYHGENKLIFNEMMMGHVLSQLQTDTFSWIFIYCDGSLKQQYAGGVLLSRQRNQASCNRYKQKYEYFPSCMDLYYKSNFCIQITIFTSIAVHLTIKRQYTLTQPLQLIVHQLYTFPITICKDKDNHSVKLTATNVDKFSHRQITRTRISNY